MRTDRSHINGLRERVGRFLVEDQHQHLCEIRELQRRAVGHHHHLRKFIRSTAGIGALIDSFIPVVHVARMRRGTPKPLETLRHRCWELGFQAGVEVEERRDFQRVLYCWARRPGAPEFGHEPETDDLAKVVVHRLRPSRFWKLLLGFLPIVGPIAASRLDVALALHFHDLATEYFRGLRSAGIRPLPDDFALPPPPRTPRDSKKDGSVDSMRRTVEHFLSEHRSAEHLFHVRGMALIGKSARAARWIAGSSGLTTNLIPIRHLQFGFRDIEAHMFLMMLQAIGLQAALNAGREDDPGDDFERVLLLWAGGSQRDETPSRDELIAAVSAKLQAAWLWKLAFGFLPLIGAVMGLMIDGSMAARLYRLAHEFYQQREPVAPTTP